MPLHLLRPLFGDQVSFVVENFLVERGAGPHDRLYSFRPGLDDEQAIHARLEQLEKSPVKREKLENGLFTLLQGVCVIPDPLQFGNFFVRRDEAFLRSPTLLELPEPQRSLFREFSRRNPVPPRDERLESLQSGTRLEITYSGDIPARSRFTPLGRSLLKPGALRVVDDSAGGFMATAPYERVVEPAHAHESLTEWWRANVVEASHFWSHSLRQYGAPPTQLEPWVADELVRRHLWTGSIWSVFSLIDLANMVGLHVKGDYLPFPVDDLLDNLHFLERVRGLFTQSKRTPDSQQSDDAPEPK
jgi:4-alpha-glucanotransferase